MYDKPYAYPLQRLRDAGLRPTRQRLSLARLLFEGDTDRHVTAEKLHEEAQAANAKVSLATVYNTLHQFTEAGLLCEVVVDSGKTYFDTNTSLHHHFFNPETGDLTDIPAEDVQLQHIPVAPEGSEIAQIDVIFRVKTN